MDVRAAVEADVDHLTQIWYDGWHDAHAEIVPAELRPFRTLDSFRQRLHAALPNVRVAGPCGAPHGFSILKDAELYQLYVSASLRGVGGIASGRLCMTRKRAPGRFRWTCGAMRKFLGNYESANL